MEVDIDWGCIEGVPEEELMFEPEWDSNEAETEFRCESCDNGPCFQYPTLEEEE